MPSVPQNWLDLAALVGPAGCRRDPLAEGRNLDWYGIYALAAGELVAPTLYAQLAESNRLPTVPTEVRDALGELHRLNAERNHRQRVVLRDTVRILNGHGIEPMVLKGAITLLPDPPVGESSSRITTRMMSDIDILPLGAGPGRAADALLDAGYRHADGRGPEQYVRLHHLAPLFHPNGHGYVEIHRTILEARVPADALALEGVREGAERVDWDGLAVWVPSIEHRLLHNALHHQVQDREIRRGGYALRQLLDFAQLRESVDAEAIDWSAHLRRLDRSGLGDTVRTYLLVVSRLFDQPLPDGVVIGRRSRRAEAVMWFWQRNPQLFLHFASSLAFSQRLRNLPALLATPSWYPRKYRQLRRDWHKRGRPSGSGPPA